VRVRRVASAPSLSHGRRDGSRSVKVTVAVQCVFVERKCMTGFNSVLALQHASVATSTAFQVSKKNNYMYLHTPYRSKFTVASHSFLATARLCFKGLGEGFYVDRVGLPIRGYFYGWLEHLLNFRIQSLAAFASRGVLCMTQLSCFDCCSTMLRRVRVPGSEGWICLPLQVSLLKCTSDRHYCCHPSSTICISVITNH